MIFIFHLVCHISGHISTQLLRIVKMIVLTDLKTGVGLLVKKNCDIHILSGLSHFWSDFSATVMNC